MQVSIFALLVLVLSCFLQGSDAIGHCTNPPYVACGQVATQPWNNSNLQTNGIRSGKLPETMQTVPMAPKKRKQEEKDILFFNVSQVLYYTSQNSNYTLSGNTNVTCLPNGTWTTPPKCVAYCNPLPVIAHGNCTGGTSLGISLNKQATCQCNTGYQLVGFTEVTCKLGNLWTEVPKCVLPTTSARTLCKSPPIIFFGTCNGPTNGTTFNSGDKTNCTCNSTYLISSTKSPICLGNGRWAKTPTCNKTCPNPPNVANADWCPTCQSSQNKTTVIFHPGDTVSHSCNAGYMMSGSPLVTCLTDGNWSPAPTCNVISDNVTKCSGVPTMAYGRCALANMNYDTSSDQGNTYAVGTQFSCICGTSVSDTNQYTMSGQSNVYCLSTGAWSVTPNCTLVQSAPQCNILSIANGQCISASNDGSSIFNVGDKINCACDPAYKLVGNATLTCQGQQTWSATMPTCVARILCAPVPTVKNGVCNYNKATQYEAGDSVICTCNSGYHCAQNNATQTITCKNNSLWTTPLACT